jgi:hypothetical protein
LVLKVMKPCRRYLVASFKKAADKCAGKCPKVERQSISSS